jgi:hypothetical protein
VHSGLPAPITLAYWRNFAWLARRHLFFTTSNSGDQSKGTPLLVSIKSFTSPVLEGLRFLYSLFQRFVR